MARPKGKTKTARLTVNLDEHAYSVLLSIAMRDDVPLAQVVRRAVADLVQREEARIQQGTLPLVRPQQEN